MNFQRIEVILIGIVLLVLFKNTQGNGITKTADGFFKCSEDPITERYTDDKYCQYYYLCHRGHAFPFRCSFRSLFHPTLKQCLPRDRIPESICPNEIKCGFNGYYKDPNDCTKYFICFYQTPTRYSCTPERIFDDKTKQCIKDKKKAEECSKPKPLKHFDTTTTTVKRSEATMRSPVLPKRSIENTPNTGNTNTNLPYATKDSNRNPEGPWYLPQKVRTSPIFY